MDLRKISIPNFKKMDKKLINKLFLFLILVVIIFVSIIIFKLVVGNRTSYENVENLMVKAAKQYYSEDETGINSFKSISSGTITIDIKTLTEKKYLKDILKLIPDKGKNITCTGKVSAKMNNGYILYTPELNCTDYQTKKLNSVITTNTVESDDGLYHVNNEYIFKGENINNYLSFAGKTWRIIKINENGQLRIIETTKRDKIKWDDRYNTEEESNTGKNDFELSRIKDELISLYENEEEFSDSNKSYIVPQTLCLGQRNNKETDNSGSIECSKTLDNWMIGLVQANEYVIASLDSECKLLSDPQCGNYNYFKSFANSYWSITAASTRTDKVYKMTPNPNIASAYSIASIRAVILIDNDSVYVKGDGTETNPYVFK